MFKNSIQQKISMHFFFNVILLSVTLILSAGIEMSVAQNNRNVSITVSANVPGAIELLTIQSIDFSGDEVELGFVRLDPMAAPNAGRMVASGNPNSEIRINYDRESVLRNNQTNNTLVLNYLVSGNATNDQETSELLDQDNRYLRFNENGQFFLWIGASVDLSTAEPGSYEGEFSIVVEYI